MFELIQNFLARQLYLSSTRKMVNQKCGQTQEIVRSNIFNFLPQQCPPHSLNYEEIVHTLEHAPISTNQSQFWL